MRQPYESGEIRETGPGIPLHRKIVMKLIYHTLLYCGLLLSTALFYGCTSRENTTADIPSVQEDPEAKRLLQGIWVNQETETASFYIQGDTIYYPDTINSPIRFFIGKDTLYMTGADTIAYPIHEMGQNIFRFYSNTGEVVRLIRSNNPDDSLYFTHKSAVPQPDNTVIKKDTVVYKDGERYHCYVYVNPSNLKVYKTSYTDEGIAVENIYYDKVIHICVYKGKECVFSQDYNKKNFAGLIPDGFLNQAILSDIDFSKTDRQGFHFHATVRIPDDVECYVTDICIDNTGKAHMTLIE